MTGCGLVDCPKTQLDSKLGGKAEEISVNIWNATNLS